MRWDPLPACHITTTAHPQSSELPHPPCKSCIAARSQAPVTPPCSNPYPASSSICRTAAHLQYSAGPPQSRASTAHTGSSGCAAASALGEAGVQESRGCRGLPPGGAAPGAACRPHRPRPELHVRASALPHRPTNQPASTTAHCLHFAHSRPWLGNLALFPPICSQQIPATF